MPRYPRLQSPTEYYHVMMRGNNKEKIFASTAYKEYFLDILKKENDDGQIEIVAYCIMDNHVHIIIKADLINLSNSMKSINTKYAMKFNFIQDRVGHVFQGRYKSEIIYDDEYLINVIRYVHNNPIMGNVVKSPDSYRWSSYKEYIKSNRIISFKQKDFVIDLYGGIENLIKFHRLEDACEYLDTKEDIEEFRLDRAHKIIQEYFRDNGIKEIKEIKNSALHYDEILKRLILDSKLSNRQIAKMLGINKNIVNDSRKVTGDSPQ